MLSICLSMLDSEEDKQSFEELYYTYKQGMYAVAYGVLHNKEDAEDAVQKAFISIANNFEKIKSVSSQELKPCIVIIVRNHAINIYNSNKRRAERTVEYDDNDSPVDVNFLENYEYEELIAVISKLPAIYRDTIFLHYVRGFTPKEIGKMLDIKVEAVWKRIERARKQLKEALEDRGDF